jgi:RNA polymerase sigma factor (sigma-70 family)
MRVSNDNEIVQRVLGGEKAAFGELIDRHRSETLAFAARILNRLDAEDVVQEAFLAAFLSLRQLRDRTRFRSWLLGITANLCRYRLRLMRQGYLHDFVGGEAVPAFVLQDHEPSPEVIYETKEIHQMLRGAIQTLPEEQRETVALHYVRGLRISEIAILSGTPAGTIKARLHRARAALRKALLAEIEGTRHEKFDGGLSMIEVCVHDIAVRAPMDEHAEWPVSVKDYYKLGIFRVLLLKEVSGDRVLPIWVGPIEGDLIAMQLEHIETPRPMTFDLMANLLRTGNVQVEKVAVTALRENTYFSTIWIRASGAVHEVDARPSDAIALALYADAPIFVAPETLAAHSLSAAKQFEQLQEETSRGEKEGLIEPDPKPTKWCSFRSMKHENFEKRKEVPIDPGFFDRYVGRYELLPNLILTITREGDRLFAQATGQSKFQLFAEGEKDYFLKVTDAQITFEVDAAGRVNQLTLHQAGRDMPAKRIVAQ